MEKETVTYSCSGTACPRYAARQLCLPGYCTGFSRCFKFSIFGQTHAVCLPLGVQRLARLLIALKSCWVWIPERSCCPSVRHWSQAPGLFGHQSRWACMQTDTPRLAKICYRVLQSGQQHLLEKSAVTAHTSVFRCCSNFLLSFAGHVSILML